MARHDFYDWQGPTPEVTVEGQRSFRLPAYFHDNDVFASLHTASYDAVAAELPSELIRPAQWTGGAALVAVYVLRYRAITFVTPDGSTGGLAPYGELAISAVVTRGPARSVLPALSGRMRGFVLHMPVTTRESRDGGMQLWGFPKFVADMDFAEDVQVRGVELSEQGEHILTLTVRPGGPVLPDHRPFIAYTSHGGRLLETTVRSSGHSQFRLGESAGHLDLGRHPVAERLRRLEVSPEPVAVFSCLDNRLLLPAGVPIGPARDYSGYTGAEREFGRLTVSYPGTAPLDQYAPIAALSGVGA